MPKLAVWMLAATALTLISGCANEDSELAAFCAFYEKSMPAVGDAMEVGPDFASLDEQAKKADLLARVERLREIYRQQQAVAPEHIRDDFQLVIDGLEFRNDSPSPPDPAAKARAETAFKNIQKVVTDDCGFPQPPSTASP